MTKDQLKAGRLKTGLTQVKAAAKLGLSQAYLSLLESGARKVTEGVAHAAARLYHLEPPLLRTPEPPRLGDVRRKLPHQLAALGYPGFSHLWKSPPTNPALVALEAVFGDNLDGRVAEAVPWVLERYPELDWKGLVTYAKVRNVQNRLGFFVTLARELAERCSNAEASAKLKEDPGKRSYAKGVVIRDRYVMFTILERRQTDVASALATDAVPKILERPRKGAAGKISREPQGVRTSSLT